MVLLELLQICAPVQSEIVLFRLNQLSLQYGHYIYPLRMARILVITTLFPSSFPVDAFDVTHLDMTIREKKRPLK